MIRLFLRLRPPPSYRGEIAQRVLNHNIKYHQHISHFSNFSNNNDSNKKIDNDDDDDSKAWMPPSHSTEAPGSGDNSIYENKKVYNSNKEEIPHWDDDSEYIDVDDDDDTTPVQLPKSFEERLKKENQESYNYDDDDFEGEMIEVKMPKKETNNKNKNDESYLETITTTNSTDTPFSMDTFLEKIKRDREKNNKSSSTSTTTTTTTTTTPDWLHTRRTNLSTPDTTMLTPKDATIARAMDGAIPPTPQHTLLTSTEITTCLKQLGGRNIKVIVPSEGLLGTIEGLIFVTGSSTPHMRILGDAIYKALRARRLHERNVNGAIYGIEGRESTEWMVIDGGNYMVHIMSEQTREDLALEKKWELETFESNQKDWTKEEVQDEYVMNNPIPDGYQERVMGSDDKMRQVKEWKKMKWKELKQQQKSAAGGRRKRGKKRKKYRG